jgi:hypothetical protein
LGLTLAERLRGKATVRRSPGVRFACCAAGECLELFFNGQALGLEPGDTWLGERLCRQLHYPTYELAPALARTTTAKLLLKLFNEGLLEFADD